MNKRAVLFLTIILLAVNHLQAGGISVDAGLTPPQDRFILRSQYRYMTMDNAMMRVNTQMTPLVLAYGLTPSFTLMARGVYVHQSFDNSPEINNGLNDPFLLSKFRLYRKNTADYVIGIASHIASNIPIGSKEVSMRAWDPELGLNVSFRPRFFAVDVSASYIFTDISEKLETRPGNIFNINTAVSTMIPLKSIPNAAFSPVAEITYSTQAASKATPSHSILFLSPGVSVIYSNLSLEALVQFPVQQTEQTSIMNRNSRLILGLKYMF
ncbi:MAG: transporter [Bacteroidales bacterium]|nr:transporter [Bacteroidales bacterium]